MKVKLKIFSTFFGVSLMLTPLAHANSYLKMITTKPEGYVSLNEKVVAYDKKPYVWYDSKVSTKSPVVVSECPKYLAYKQAKQNNFYYFNLRETLQDMIYFMEAMALGRFLYKIYEN